MFSANEKISSAQIGKLLVFNIVSLSIIILPGIAASGAGRDGLTAIAAGSFAAIIYSLFFVYASGRVKGEYMEFSAKTAGGFLTFIFGALYIIKIVFSCWFALTLFAKVINDALLPDTNERVIVFTLILVSIYAASKGIEVRARLAEVFFVIVMLPLIVLFVFGFKGIELTNLFPLFTESNGKILYTGYSVLLTYSAIEILLFAAPALTSDETREKLYKSVILAIVTAAIINIILFVLVLGLLGLAGACRQFKSSIMIMQLIQVPGGFVQRQDAVMLTIWLISIFTVLSAYFYYAAKITGSMLRTEKTGFTLVFYGVALFALCYIQIPIEVLFYYYGKYMAYIGFPQSVCIPLVVIAASKIRHWMGASYEKEASYAKVD